MRELGYSPAKFLSYTAIVSSIKTKLKYAGILHHGYTVMSKTLAQAVTRNLYSRVVLTGENSN